MTAKGIVELLIPARAEYLQLVRTVVGEAEGEVEPGLPVIQARVDMGAADVK